MSDAPEQHVPALVTDALDAEITELRLLAEKLVEFAAGDDTAWTPTDSLATHQLAVRVQSHTSVVRAWRDRHQRTATVVRLDDHRGALRALVTEHAPPGS